MKTKTALVVLGALASAAAVGCGSSSSSSGEDLSAVRATLHRSADCNSLLADLKADARYKLNRTIDRQIEAIRSCQKAYPDNQCAYVWGGYYGAERGGVAYATSEAAPAADNAASGAAASGGAKSASAASYSTTNVQVQGVDEADFVKNDGTYIYLLHGDTLKVVQAWPATALKEAGSIKIDGTPNEMFVANGKVVIYSQVNGADIFAKAGVKPKVSYQDFGWVAPADAVATSAGSSSSGDAAKTSPGTPGTATTYAPLTKITMLALDGATPRVIGEEYFEGNYLDARRIDNHVRTVISSYQYGPQLKYGIYDLDPNKQYTTGSQVIAALGALRAVNTAAIDQSQLGDWLPYTFVKNGDSVSAQTTACSDFYIPNVGSTEGGMTKVSSLDLNDPNGAPKETAILGLVDTVYGDATSLYLASRAWTDPPLAWAASGSTVSTGSGSASAGAATEPAPAPAADAGAAKAQSLGIRTSPMLVDGVFMYSQSNTHVHKFDFTTDPTFPNYLASGTVKGNVKDQFSLDAKDGNLRIATTEWRSYVAADGSYVSGDTSTTGNPVRPQEVNHLYVLGQNGGWLDPIGAVDSFAPNESIQSVRFVGNRGYVTTYRQVDPLFVFDLSQPKAPTMLGALTIPGFSEYMQPFDDNHLLTIGRGASTSQLQLQIFDVTDGAHPKVAKAFTYDGSEYGGSDAEYDHHAFTWFPAKGLLAFPYYAYGNGVNGGYRSSLEVFHVDLAGGFQKLGSVDSSPLFSAHPQGYACGYFPASTRRGVFLENFVYGITYAGIVAKDVNNLAAAGTSLPLPSPEYNAGYGPVAYDCAY